MTLPDYKNHRIEVTEKGVFNAYKDREEVASAITLEELKKKVDLLMRQKWKNVHVYVYRDEKFREATLTSAKQTGSYNKDWYFRATWKQEGTTRWEDFPASRITKDTPHNQQKIKEYNEAKDKITDLEKLSEKLEESLEQYTDKELMGE